MSNRAGRWQAALLVAALALGVLAVPASAHEVDDAPAAPAELSRLWGADRYETSLEIARRFVNQSGGRVDAAVVVSGTSWEDAVVAAALAGSLDAPILLARPEGLSNDALSLLRSAGVSQAVVVGPIGDSAADGFTELIEFATVEFVGEADPVGTSVAVARRVGTPGVVPGLGVTAVVASSAVFADALAAGGFSARGTHPVLLTPSDRLDPRVASFLAGSEVEHVVVMGGQAAVSAAVVDELREFGLEVTRVGGETRLHTAELFAEFLADAYADEAGGKCFDGTTVGLASARVPFDALSSAPLLGLLCAPLLLTERASISAATAEFINAAALRLIVLGGPAAVPAEVLAAVSDEPAIEPVFAAAAERRAAIVAELTAQIAQGHAGIGDDGVLSDAHGFRIDLSDCPEGWSDTDGVTGDEIRIGNATALTGLQAAYGRIVEGFRSYLAWVNEHAPVDGKQITLVTTGDSETAALTPEAAVDALIADSDVLSVLSLRSTSALSVYDQVNRQCVPHPFVLTSHPAWGDPELRPWTSGHQLSYATEAVLWGEWIRRNLGNELPVRVGALVMDNNFGHVYENAFRAWADENPAVVSEFHTVRHTPAAVTWDQVRDIALAQPDVYISMTAAAPCVTAMQLAESTALAPNIRLGTGALFTSSICQDAGYMLAAGAAADGFRVVHDGTLDLSDPANAGDPFVSFMRSRLSHDDLDPSSSEHASGYSLAFAYVEALRIAAELPGGVTRTNLMLAVRSLDITHPLYVPGVAYRMRGNADAYPVEGSHVGIWDAQQQAWRTDGDVLDADGATPNCVWSASLTQHAAPHCGAATNERLTTLSARGAAGPVAIGIASASAFAAGTPGPEDQLQPGYWEAEEGSFCAYWDGSAGIWRRDTRPDRGYVRVNGAPVEFDPTTRIRLDHGDVLTVATVSGAEIGAQHCTFNWAEDPHNP